MTKKHAFSPGPSLPKTLRVIANNIDDRTQEPKLKRPPVLRHEHDVAEASVSHVMDELDQRGGVAQIQDRVRLEAMAISTRDHGKAGLLCQSDDFLVLVPAAQSVHFQTVKRGSVIAEKPAKSLRVSIAADAFLIH
jgi:hypothetical protein